MRATPCYPAFGTASCSSPTWLVQYSRFKQLVDAGLHRNADALTDALVELHLGFVRDFDYHRKPLTILETGPASLAADHKVVVVTIIFDASFERRGGALHRS